VLLAGVVVADGLVDLPRLLTEQLAFQWERLTRPRLDGLTDQEYFGEPVPDCWTLRLGSKRNGETADDLVMDLGEGDDDLPPFTTIAWRLAHVTRHILGGRAHSLFGGPDPDLTELASTARAALDHLDVAYGRWQDGVAAMSPLQLAGPCGADERYFQGRPVATLVLHVNREVLCHCAEISLLRDLYARIPPAVPEHIQS
jgi:hypothetical protein